MRCPGKDAKSLDLTAAGLRWLFIASIEFDDSGVQKRLLVGRNREARQAGHTRLFRG